MQKATVTYVAPLGDNKVVEMGGVTFFDGKPVEINSHDHPHIFEKLKTNQHFDIEVGKEDENSPTRPKVKRGRPSNADIAAAKAEADEADKAAKVATDRAAEAKKNVEATTKADVKPTAEAKADVKPTALQSPFSPAGQQAAQLSNQPGQAALTPEPKPIV